MIRFWNNSECAFLVGQNLEQAYGRIFDLSMAAITANYEIDRNVKSTQVRDPIVS